MTPLNDFLTAVQFLTRIPVPTSPWTPDSLPRAVKFFPIVGALLGAIAALAHALLTPHLPRLAAAALTVTLLVLITGAFHEDGLADAADGFGGGHSREKILEILRDSRIGSYGGAALALSIITRIALIAALPLEHVTATLIAAHVLCRWTTLPLSYFVPPARPAGDGQATSLLLSPASLAIGTTFAVAVAILLLKWRAAPALAAAIAVTALTGAYYRHRIGGVTGDCFGATNQLTEITTYLVGAWVLTA